MRKLIVTLMLLLYVIPNFGINITVHYCGGKFSSLSLAGTSPENKCACGNKKMKQNCCQDKDFLLQFDDVQIQPSQNVVTFAKSFKFPMVLPQTVQFEYDFCPLTYNSDYFPPPPNNVKPPLYLLHQVFRI